MALPNQTQDPPSFSTNEELEELLLEGLNSGEPIEVTPEFWANLHAGLANKHPTVRKAS